MGVERIELPTARFLFETFKKVYLQSRALPLSYTYGLLFTKRFPRSQRNTPYKLLEISAFKSFCLLPSKPILLKNLTTDSLKI